MRKEHVIGGAVLGVLALGASAYAGYKHRDEIKAGVTKAGKVTKEKTKLAQTAVKDKADALGQNVKEGTDKLVKKLDSSTSIVDLFKQFEQEFKNSIAGEKVSEKELESLKAHFEQFSLEPTTSSAYVVDDSEDIILDENDYTIEREDYPK